MSITPRTVRWILGISALILTVACGTGGTAYRATTTTPSVYQAEQDLNDAILDTVWAQQSPVDQAAVCAEVRLYGSAAAARVVLSGMDDPTFTISQVADKLETWCL